MRALGIVIVWLAIVVTTTADAKKAQPCPGGRYLVSGPSLVGALDGAMDVVEMSGKMIGVASGCAPVKSRVRGNAAHGTKIRARWSSCFGLTGTIVLTGTITDACRTLTGTVTAKSAGVVTPFLASLSSCGDGIWDPDGGEQCDAGLGPCGDLCNACTCGSVTSTTTGSSTTGPTSTTQPGSTTTTPPTTLPGGSTTTTSTMPVTSTTSGGGSTTTTTTTHASTTTTSTHASTTTLVFPTTTSTSLPGATTTSTMPALPTTTTTSTTLAGPDLAQVDWMSPGTAPSGSQIAIQFTVKNFGTATAAGGFYDYIMFSTDYAFGGDTALAVVQHNSSVAPGGAYTTLVPMVQLPVIGPGTYYLYLQTDGTNAVPETNENNNIGGFVAITIS